MRAAGRLTLQAVQPLAQRAAQGELAGQPAFGALMAKVTAALEAQRSLLGVLLLRGQGVLGAEFLGFKTRETLRLERE